MFFDFVLFVAELGGGGAQNYLKIRGSIGNKVEITIIYIGSLYIIQTKVRGVK